MVVGITGASGLVYALDLLHTLRQLDVESRVVVTAGAKHVIPTELDGTLHDIEALATRSYKDSDLGADIASGSYRSTPWPWCRSRDAGWWRAPQIPCLPAPSRVLGAPLVLRCASAGSRPAYQHARR